MGVESDDSCEGMLALVQWWVLTVLYVRVNRPCPTPRKTAAARARACIHDPCAFIHAHSPFGAPACRGNRLQAAARVLLRPRVHARPAGAGGRVLVPSAARREGTGRAAAAVPSLRAGCGGREMTPATFYAGSSPGRPCHAHSRPPKCATLFRLNPYLNQTLTSIITLVLIQPRSPA